MATNRRSKALLVVPEEDKWRARDDAETLSRAHEIMGDKKRMTHAHAHVKEHMDKLSKVLATGKPAGEKKLGPKPPAPKAKDGVPAKKPTMKVPQPPKAKGK
jgi:hypothetical protein